LVRTPNSLRLASFELGDAQSEVRPVDFVFKSLYLNRSRSVTREIQGYPHYATAIVGRIIYLRYQNIGVAENARTTSRRTTQRRSGGSSKSKPARNEHLRMFVSGRLFCWYLRALATALYVHGAACRPLSSATFVVLSDLVPIQTEICDEDNMRDDASEPAVSVHQFGATTASAPSSRLNLIAKRQSSEKRARSVACEPADQSLVERFRVGDQDAATQLYFRYRGRLKRLVKRRCSADLARRAGVEDIVQSVFEATFRRIGAGCYQLHEGEALWKLLRVITLNAIRSQATYHYAAKRDSRRTSSEAESGLSLESQPCSSDRVSGQFDLALRELLDRLPAKTRLLAWLRIEGFDVAEVARITGRSRRTVERALQKTRLNLVDVFECGA
jgi:RNA polymerase sigma-70 factor (ECF subfamily)